MNIHISKKAFYQPLTGVILSIMLSSLLSACGMALAYTPEDAAVRDLNNEAGRGSGGQIDTNSIKVLQSSTLSERTFVFVSYEGVDSHLGGVKMTCVKLFEMRKAILGMWAPSSATGSCESEIQVAGGQNDQPEPPPQPITIGGGRSSGDGKNDLGTSMASGQVLDKAIKAIKVTWKDGVTTQVDVVNGSYVAVRQGAFEMAKVEALDEKGSVVYTWQPQAAPGKQ